MRVKALMKGYYGDLLRTEGEIFVLVPRSELDRRTGKTKIVSDEDQFSHEWMERVDGGVAPEKTRIMPSDVVAPPPPPSAPKTVPQPPSLNPAPSANVGTDEPTGNAEVI